MLLGNRRRFAVELDPIQPGWERNSPADQGPWARLVIWVSDRNLTANWRSGGELIRPGVFVPLAPLADWLVRNARFIAFEESAHPFSTDANLIQSLDQWRESAPAEDYDDDTWDDERFNWSDRHFLSAGADGAWLPNLAMVRSDDTLWLSWAPARFASEQAPVFLERGGLTAIPFT